MPTLMLTPRFTPDAQALWRAAGQLGWDVERLTRWRVPDELRRVAEPVPYLEGLLGPTLAEQLRLRLLEPPRDWRPRLPEEYRKRRVLLTTLRAARSITETAFIIRVVAEPLSERTKAEHWEACSKAHQDQW